MDVDSYIENLQRSILGANHRAAAPMPPSESVCASYKREEDLQYRFMVFYQSLVAILAAVTLLLLIFAAWLVSQGSPTFNGVLVGAAAIVTGGGALFLLNQRKDAQARYKAVQRTFAKSGCP